MSVVKKAVFPIAGLGTRFLPATKASAKEMLPVVDKPLIQYAVEEAYAAGIRHMIFVTGRTKRSVEDHFDTAYELENELELAGKTALLDVARSIAPDDMICTYVRQSRAMGLGHAVLCSKELVGNEPFAVLLADDLMIGKPAIIAQMVEQFVERQASILAVQDVPREHTRRYGIVSGQNVMPGLVDVSGIIEKPSPDVAPTTLAVAGRYVLTPGIFRELENMPHGVGGEIQLTDGIARLMQHEKVFAYRYAGVRYDCGSKLGFLQATVDLGERHSEVGDRFSAWLQQRGTHLTTND
ncbi:UDP-glucose pyrophosphorylase [Nitrosomonas eutropha]|uniref:UTP--glucose-1-phosphate uridylyltransferase n=1 Tax=Nitrosomonas eutropha TaxID=916 RepID=A0A1I7HYY3_9PROT|nr:UTP--glucose-1-phosphate uridylyltransferase GalU [Nitrosomonas eutropha]SFU65905.1 UDP-glucose pyrophosphorylase [Nitrosomonas eutropha]